MHIALLNCRLLGNELSWSARWEIGKLLATYGRSWNLWYTTGLTYHLTFLADITSKVAAIRGRNCESISQAIVRIIAKANEQNSKIPFDTESETSSQDHG